MAGSPQKAKDFNKKWASIMKKTAEDEVFKQRLLKNPAQVLKDFEIEVPANFNLKVLEETSNAHYLILPESKITKGLSEEQLRNVSGGAINAYITGQYPC